MWLIDLALRRPITILVAVISIALGAMLALQRMPVDIFPNLNLPVIYVAQPYGGMDPAQMEGYLVYYYEYHFLYITGIEHVESKSIQNVGLIKLVFHPGTDMAQALAQTIGYVDRARAIMPAGNVRTGELTRITPINSVVRSIRQLQELPIRTGAGPTVFLRDVGTVENSSDILTGYALVNGRRTVYISVNKRADASTLAVVEEVKKNLPRFRSVVPEDITISYEFDQSAYVRNALG